MGVFWLARVPGFYEIIGGAISHVYGCHTNDVYPSGFFNYHWVDDHINVSVNIGASCYEIARSLRYAMVTILGAEVINDDKFTTFWRWTLSPKQSQCRLLKLKKHCVTVSDDMKQDLLLWWQVLHTHHLNGVSPGCFNTLPPSDMGSRLCALDGFAKAALTYQFSTDELSHILEFKNGSINAFDINFRELISCAFAVHAWGALWSSKVSRGGHPYHMHFRIDNVSAVG
ncbi:LOW QUALITY PROTEIN: hypothetical protein PHMEG_00021016 [Phytophthora megakarya]|uniref:Uncharacterized protein n=1 Tax=Phytophthora megakarya TaxID=4795 RepID=A0A225VPM0_9STRA|nr:LOW QUALITY PROTEIN: hypothetical protein PHMEG_00021016 [Phytophthora megakarya]